MANLEKTKERGQGGMVGGNLIDPGLKTVVRILSNNPFELNLLSRKKGTASRCLLRMSPVECGLILSRFVYFNRLAAISWSGKRLRTIRQTCLARAKTYNLINHPVVCLFDTRVSGTRVQVVT
jgi:hypothetical protein